MFFVTMTLKLNREKYIKMANYIVITTVVILTSVAINSSTSSILLTVISP